jgi:membrane AbrB-like protein
MAKDRKHRKFSDRARLGDLLRLAFGYAAAAAAGYGASLIHLPLAWVLGPLIAAAAIGIAGMRLPAPTQTRRAGQLIIGSTAGLSMTASVVAGLAAWLPLMLVTALFSILVSATFSTLFARFAHIDGKTAFFAVLPGGLSEMGNIGANIGAQMEPIALIQALRIAVVVMLIPPLMVAHGLYQAPEPIPDLAPEFVVLALATGLAGALLAHLAGFNNPWIVGALIATGILTALGVTQGRMPHLIFALGQVLVGYNIGTRFRRETLRKLPRVAAIGIGIILLMVLVMALYALVVSRLTGIDFAIAILSSSPGGTAEMATTAQILHLPVALITAFHVVRAILVNGFATYYWRVLTAIGYLPALERLMNRPGQKS